MFRSTNPALKSDTFQDMPYVANRQEAMSTDGVIFKSLLLLGCLFLSAGYTWSYFISMGASAAAAQALQPWMMGSIFGGFIVAAITIFKKEWAPFTAPAYALIEGVFIGAISSILNVQFPGIPIQAALLTFGTLSAMLIAYQTGMVRATEKFKTGVIAATGGIAIVYLASIVLSFFGVQIPFIYGNSLFSIAVSLFVCGIAALNLIIDFDFIEQGTQMGLPKYMEWYAGFSLMVTLVWLYIEFLRLLSKLRSR